MGRRVLAALAGIGIGFLGYLQVWVTHNAHQAQITLTGADLSLISGSLIAVLAAAVLIWSYLGRVGRKIFAITIGVVSIVVAITGVSAYLNTAAIEIQLGNQIGLIGADLEYSQNPIGIAMLVAGMILVVLVAALAVIKPIAKSSAASRIDKSIGENDDPIGIWDSQR